MIKIYLGRRFWGKLYTTLFKEIKRPEFEAKNILDITPFP